MIRTYCELKGTFVFKANYKEELESALQADDAEKAKEILRKTMNDKIQQGWIIRTKTTFDLENKICCAVGSLLDESPCLSDLFASGMDFFYFQKLLDIVHGFDYPNEPLISNKWTLAGQELAEEFIK